MNSDIQEFEGGKIAAQIFDFFGIYFWNIGAAYFNFQAGGRQAFIPEKIRIYFRIIDIPKLNF